MDDPLKPVPLPPFPTDAAADVWLGFGGSSSDSAPDDPIVEAAPPLHPFRQRAAEFFEQVREGVRGEGLMPPRVMHALRTPDQVGIGDAWTFSHAMSSPGLLGPGYDGPSWNPWREFLSVVDGRGAWRDEAFCRMCLGFEDNQPIPKVRPDEMWMIVGRRGGKSAVAAGIATTLGMARWESRPGEHVRVLIQAQLVDRAKQILDYAEGMLTNPEMFPGMVGMLDGEPRTKSLPMTSGTVIEIGSASESAARGPSLAASICDEIASWAQSSGQYLRGRLALKDQQVLNAIRPALSLTGGPLIALSSPKLRRGAMWDAYKNHFRKSWAESTGRRVMVWKAPSLTMNPNNERLKREVAQAYEDDPIQAEIEYGAEFAGEPNTAIAREVVEAAVESGVTVRPPRDGIRYSAYMDAATGAGPDNAGFAIAHAEGGKLILDMLGMAHPPFGAPDKIAEWRQVAKTYRCDWVSVDQWALGKRSRWLRMLQEAGFKVDRSERDTSGNYYDLITMLQADRVVLLDSIIMVDELAGLERHEPSSRRTPIITHRPGFNDDVAAAVAGALCNAGLRAGAPLTIGRGL